MSGTIGGKNVSVNYSGTATGTIYWGTDSDGKLTYGPSQTNSTSANHSASISLGYSGTTSGTSSSTSVKYVHTFDSVKLEAGAGDVSLSHSGCTNSA